jgi:tRNA1(Val) A37 N6-methylase TrmN6
MEEFTDIPAKALLAQSGLLASPSPNVVVLDNACGSGVITRLLFDTIGNDRGVRVVCGDLEERMIQFVSERIKANAWNAEAKIVDAQVCPVINIHHSTTGGSRFSGYPICRQLFHA